MEFRRVARLAGGLAFVVLVGAACKAADDQPLVILEMRPPATGMASSSGCGESSFFVSSGVLDVGLLAAFPGHGYLSWPVVLNRELSNASQNGGVESARVTVTGADVDLCFDAACTNMFGLLANEQHFRQTLYKVIDPQVMQPIAVELIPSTAAAKIAAANPTLPLTATVSLKIVGRSNELDVKSNTVQFAVNICSGCLVHSLGTCSTTTVAVNAGSCNPVQDSLIDCCTNSTGGTVCPAHAPTP